MAREIMDILVNPIDVASSNTFFHEQTVEDLGSKELDPKTDEKSGFNQNSKWLDTILKSLDYAMVADKGMGTFVDAAEKEISEAFREKYQPKLDEYVPIINGKHGKPEFNTDEHGPKSVVPGFGFAVMYANGQGSTFVNEEEYKVPMTNLGFTIKPGALSNPGNQSNADNETVEPASADDNASVPSRPVRAPDPAEKRELGPSPRYANFQGDSGIQLVGGFDQKTNVFPVAWKNDNSLDAIANPSNFAAEPIKVDKKDDQTTDPAHRKKGLFSRGRNKLRNLNKLTRRQKKIIGSFAIFSVIAVGVGVAASSFNDDSSPSPNTIEIPSTPKKDSAIDPTTPNIDPVEEIVVEQGGNGEGVMVQAGRMPDQWYDIAPELVRQLPGEFTKYADNDYRIRNAGPLSQQALDIINNSASNR